MAMTEAERRAKMREYNRNRYHNDPEYRAKQAIRVKVARAKQGKDDPEPIFAVKLLRDEGVWGRALHGGGFQDANVRPSYAPRKMVTFSGVESGASSMDFER